MKELTTLEAFIKGHKDLISVTGVFAALSLFAQTFMGGTFGTVLALVFYSGFVLLWLELWGTFPKNGTTKLEFFENLLTIVVLMSLVYWYAQAYHFSADTFTYAIGLPLGAFVMTFVSNTMRKYGLYEKLFGDSSGSTARSIFGIALVCVILAPILFFTSYVVKHSQKYLDEFLIPILNLLPVETKNTQNPETKEVQNALPLDVKG